MTKLPDIVEEGAIEKGLERAKKEILEEDTDRVKKIVKKIRLAIRKRKIEIKYLKKDLRNVESGNWEALQRDRKNRAITIDDGIQEDSVALQINLDK